MGILFKHEVASQLCPLLTEYGANPADSPGELGGWDGAGLGGRQQRVAEFREAVAGGVLECGGGWHEVGQVCKRNICPACCVEHFGWLLGSGRSTCSTLSSDPGNKDKDSGVGSREGRASCSSLFLNKSGLDSRPCGH